MGTGLGPRQRHILDVVQRHSRGFFYLKDLVTLNPTKSNYNAYQRAAQTLVERGLISTVQLEGGVMVLRSDEYLDAAVRWELRDFLAGFVIPDAPSVGDPAGGPYA